MTRVPVTLLAAASLALAVAPASAWAPPSAAETELHAGRSFSEVQPAPDGAVMIHAVVDIPAPPRQVWQVMTDCKALPRLVTSAIGCRVLQADPAHHADIRETVTKGNLFLPTLHNVVREEMAPYTSIRFSKAGGDLRIEQGEWRLQALDGGATTRVTYENLVSADILLPPSIVRAAIRKDTAKVLENLRRETLATLQKS